MDISTQNFGRDELAALELRGLFERRGFRRVRVNKFEDYDLYIENKNFLDTHAVITFMDLDGKLLALKPDITLSVVKNIPRKELPYAQKLYYLDEVYRLSRENREYKVHNQIGVELIGPPDDFSNLEIVDLALESLTVMSPSSVLDISHLGFLSGLLEEMQLSHRDQRRVLKLIHAKNVDDLARNLTQAGVEEERQNRILALTTLHGTFAKSLEAAKSLISNQGMEDAWNELSRLTGILKPEDSRRVHLDFSVVNDLDYYNGLIFRGYVEGVPKHLLSGGRYDNLMKRMRKHSGAIGFGISLDELGIYLKSGRRHDFDLLVTYPMGCDYAALLQCHRELCTQGLRVRLAQEGHDFSGNGFTYNEQGRFIGGKLLRGEVGSC